MVSLTDQVRILQTESIGVLSSLWLGKCQLLDHLFRFPKLAHCSIRWCFESSWDVLGLLNLYYVCAVRGGLAGDVPHAIAKLPLCGQRTGIIEGVNKVVLVVEHGLETTTVPPVSSVLTVN